jgi:hypothetical protein
MWFIALLITLFLFWYGVKDDASPLKQPKVLLGYIALGVVVWGVITFLLMLIFGGSACPGFINNRGLCETY